MTSQEKEELKKHLLPSHVAIIPDGNRRWAKQYVLKPTEGHRKGAEVVTSIVVAAKKFGVKAITFFGFSTENWKRPSWEVSTLIYLMDEMLKRELPNLIKEGIVLHTIGELDPFPTYLKNTVAKVKEETKGGTGIDFILALNYGGRDELKRALSKIVEGVVEGRITKESLSEKLIADHLDTSRFNDPDLIIRTSGEMRTSNFLPWQSSYSEWVLIDKFWPNFTPDDLFEALLVYQKRDRRKGGGS